MGVVLSLIQNKYLLNYYILDVSKGGRVMELKINKKPGNPNIAVSYNVVWAIYFSCSASLYYV